MKSKLSLILLLITAGAANAIDWPPNAASWTPYTSAEFGFTSRFPGPANKQSIPLPMGMNASLLLSFYKEGFVWVMAARFPADYNAFIVANNVDKYSILEAFMRGSCSYSTEEIKVVQDSVTMTQTVFGGHKALDVSYISFYRDTPIYTKGLLFYTADTMFFLQATTESFELSAKNLLQLDFKLTTKALQPTRKGERQRPVIPDADNT